MAWKRGVQNNQAKDIRKGHIREFRAPSSRELSVTFKARVVVVNAVSTTSSVAARGKPIALTNFCLLPAEVVRFGIAGSGSLYIHARCHPTSVVACRHDPDMPSDCIALSEVHLANCKVCVGEVETWTVYQGEVFTYDAREASIGDTSVRSLGWPPNLASIVLDIRNRNSSATHGASIDALLFRSLVSRNLDSIIVTKDEVYLAECPAGDGTQVVDVVCQVAEVYPCNDDECLEGEVERSEKESVGGEACQPIDSRLDYCVDDYYRGFVTSETVIYFIVKDNHGLLKLCNDQLEGETFVAPQPSDVVEIITSDNEVFPVKRKLLRPCIALTSIVQAGKGKYRSREESSCELDSQIAAQHEDGSHSDRKIVDMDACTFDRILLFLEHVARSEEFKFDPLLAPELRAAAEKLGVQGLVDACDKVLGSFVDRVRRAPIRFEEIQRRNELGTKVFEETGKRGDTLLVMSGMVLDITRWLEEHPGGSTIIPRHALGVDCTEYFEIYHASRQSYLYLKEFYIGELAEEDLTLLQGLAASEAFVEELNKITSSWRLKREDLVTQEMKIHKSF